MEPAGVLVVRAWVEDDELPGLRARITLSTGDGDTVVSALAGAEEICAALRSWLEGLRGQRAAE